MRYQLLGKILGAAYVGPFTEYSWVAVAIAIAIGVIIVCVAYRAVFKKKAEEEEKRMLAEMHQQKEPQPVHLEEQPTTDAKGITKIAPKEENREDEEVIKMPFKGRLMPLEEVNDPIFSEKLMGDGFAIEPSGEEIVAPVSGIVLGIADNKHTITFKTKINHQVILHIGLGTTALDGYCLGVNIKEGNQIEAGEIIGKIDLEQLIAKGASIVSPVIFTDLKDEEKLVIKETGLVELGMSHLVVIEKKA